jgi:hypothetical protein
MDRQILNILNIGYAVEALCIHMAQKVVMKLNMDILSEYVLELQKNIQNGAKGKHEHPGQEYGNLYSI